MKLSCPLTLKHKLMVLMCFPERQEANHCEVYASIMKFKFILLYYFKSYSYIYNYALIRWPSEAT